MRSKLCLSSILLHRQQGVRPGPACRRQTRQKSETVFRKFVPCGPESFQALSSAGQTNNCPGNRGRPHRSLRTLLSCGGRTVRTGSPLPETVCHGASPCRTSRRQGRSPHQWQDRKGAMRKGKDTAAQDDGAGDHAYLAFQGFLATACHGKAGFFPCFPAAFQSVGRAPGRLFRKQRVAPCPVARSAGEDEGPGGFGKLNDAHSRQGRSTMPSQALLPFRRVHGHQSAVPAARFVCLWRSHVTGSHRLDPLERTKN